MAQNGHRLVDSGSGRYVLQKQVMVLLGRIELPTSPLPTASVPNQTRKETPFRFNTLFCGCVSNANGVSWHNIDTDLTFHSCILFDTVKRKVLLRENKHE
jgi:hypothetical protein